MFRKIFVALGLFGFIVFTSNGQIINSSQIDSLVNLTLKTFDVPGISVAVVKDGKVVHSKGYGLRSLKNNLPTDENTLFGIASNSKAFTASALAILVDEGKLKWDDKVREYIPEFKLYSPFVTEEFTIKDLLTHRSGLGLGAGDLMMFPDSSDFTRKDIIYNLRYLKPVSGFRTQYDYDNNLYIVAGEVIQRITGISWEDFIDQRILKPLGMNSTAGGIVSNLPDLCKWITMQMNGGRYGDSLKKKIFSPEQHNEMWSPQTIIPTFTAPPYNTHFAAYGLGWFLSDVKGYKQVTHTGGLAGVVTQVTLLPELKLGIIVLTNQQSGAAFTAITNTIKDSYLGVTGLNRVKQMKDRVEKN